MNHFVKIATFLWALFASSLVFAQDALSIKIPQKMDQVNIERESFGQTSKMDFFVLTEKDSSERIISFNQGIKELGINGEIVSCSLLIKVPSGKDHVYGGFCSLAQGSKKMNLYVCNDDMVGHFALYHASVTIEYKPMLIQFVASNCLGGG